jgi:A/G-specific adenine glycosylase
MWRRLPGAVEQTFTHFTLRLTLFVARFDGAAPIGHFWVAPDAVAEAGFSNLMRKAVAHAASRRATRAPS